MPCVWVCVSCSCVCVCVLVCMEEMVVVVDLRVVGDVGVVNGHLSGSVCVLERKGDGGEGRQDKTN